MIQSSKNNYYTKINRYYWLELELCLPCVLRESYAVQLRPAVDVLVLPYSVRLAMHSATIKIPKYYLYVACIKRAENICRLRKYLKLSE